MVSTQARVLLFGPLVIVKLDMWLLKNLQAGKQDHTRKHTWCRDQRAQKVCIAPLGWWKHLLLSFACFVFTSLVVFFLLEAASTMKFSLGTLVVAASTALPLINAITPDGMLAAPRRGAAVANPSGV